MVKACPKITLILFLLLSQPLLAKDLGTFGELFPVIEESLLEVIKNKIKSLAENGDLEKYQQNITQRVIKNIERPWPVQGLSKTKTARSFFYDPSIMVPYDLKDDKNVVFHKSGTIVNPLDSHQLKAPLLFIDGDDSEQVDWALRYKEINSKIILVKGAPFELMKKYDMPIYFDQGGSLVTKFGISQIPARITQEGKTLKVEEVLASEEKAP